MQGVSSYTCVFSLIQNVLYLLLTFIVTSCEISYLHVHVMYHILPYVFSHCVCRQEDSRTKHCYIQLLYLENSPLKIHNYPEHNIL